MQIRNLFNDDDRAVSPVIGVILMVAITVILAAVIGTFVLGLGDSLGDSAPQASFSTDNVTNNTAGDTLYFDVEKTGGQDLDPGDLTLIVDGERHGTVATEGDVDNPWQTGTTAAFSVTGSGYDVGNTVEIRFVHDPSGDIIYSTTRTIRST